MSPFGNSDIARGPSKVHDFHRFPVTIGYALFATAATLYWLAGYVVPFMFLDIRAWRREAWRFVTSTLLHVGFIHLAFSLYWLWVFGILMESVLGWKKYVLFILGLAVGTGAAEYALFQGGVGFSGEVYGMFGFLCLAGRSDPRFRDAIDTRIYLLLVGWFFLCIVLTGLGCSGSPSQ